jgi:hypothetical protein
MQFLAINFPIFPIENFNHLEADFRRRIQCFLFCEHRDDWEVKLVRNSEGKSCGIASIRCAAQSSCSIQHQNNIIQLLSQSYFSILVSSQNFDPISMMISVMVDYKDIFVLTQHLKPILALYLMVSDLCQLCIDYVKSIALVEDGELLQPYPLHKKSLFPSIINNPFNNLVWIWDTQLCTCTLYIRDTKKQYITEKDIKRLKSTLWAQEDFQQATKTFHLSITEFFASHSASNQTRTKFYSIHNLLE